MALIEFDESTGVWYRSARLFIRPPPGETKQWRYKTLEEAVRLNPTLPVRNPETGEVRSLRFQSIGHGKEILTVISDNYIEEAIASIEE